MRGRRKSFFGLRDFQWHAEFEWKIQDLWVGAFWKRIGNDVDLWICFLPCVPLHISWWWTAEPRSEEASDGR